MVFSRNWTDEFQRVEGEMKNRFVVIMAGGKGERFWPQSRLKRPKHLLPIVGDSAMLVQTIERLDGLIPADKVFVITNSEQRNSILKTCSNLIPERVIGEPIGRDTAAAVGLAALLVENEGDDASFALLPADHVIEQKDQFQSTLVTAFEAAEAENILVTVGIKPTYSSTGYGYLEQGNSLIEYNGRTIFKVNRFVEKPNLEKAEEYLDSGIYFWNAGMFVWRPSVILSEIGRWVPDLSKELNSLRESWVKSGNLEQAMSTYYPKMKKTSIDFAVMEKAERVAMVESSFDWDDVGEWPAIARHYPADKEGNVFKGAGLGIDSKNNLTFADEGHCVSLMGVKDLIVVQSMDATLVCHKDYAQKVKVMAQEIAKKHPELS